MGKAIEIFHFIKSRLNKYWIAVIFFVIITFFVGESTIAKRFSYNRQIKQLESEIEYYTKQKDENEQKLKDLHSDNESLEKLAREQYQMTKENEELFLIKD
ncbi:MAG: septum formation initiator family protein [Bacteroidales bacterium]|nr:septum formation initiator family protein [Bacteroidales bacterium]